MICELQRYTSSVGTILYNLGCKTESKCQLLNDTLHHLVGREVEEKRDIEARGETGSAERAIEAREARISCMECCDTPFCNQNGCNITAPLRVHRGPFCYACNQTRDPDRCDHFMECKANEVCMVYRPHELSSLPDVIYRSKCDTLQGCQAVMSAGHSCATCCADDFCNTHCGVNPILPTLPTTPPPPTTTTPPTTTAGACSEHHHYDEMSQLCLRIVEERVLPFLYADFFCKGMGDILVEIDTHEKYIFLQSVLLRHSALPTNQQKYWIGASTKPGSDVFHWQSGARLQSQYWARHLTLTSHTDSRCALVDGTQLYMWNKDRCTASHHFICSSAGNSNTNTSSSSLFG
ncbi:uncharacterized protein LOC128223752 isoform X2 [Mya arenaria]|uniref:uncharacterized protein LOC128223752 isoform X2 n=1 Tax=Mya arenaria TaxID=6604 RepID=UPI0022E2C7EE|nr:uncharacterized protein LOC128223752 isoform X2 [Mya arenaria]